MGHYYQAIVYGRVLSSAEWSALAKDQGDLSAVLEGFKPEPVASYQAEPNYLGYIIAASDPAVTNNMIADRAMRLEDLAAYVRRRFNKTMFKAEISWAKLRVHVHKKTGVRLGEGELLFVADYD